MTYAGHAQNQAYSSASHAAVLTYCIPVYTLTVANTNVTECQTPLQACGTSNLQMGNMGLQTLVSLPTEHFCQ